LRFVRVDNSGAYSIPSETGLLIPSGVGIRGMRERVRHFRGELVIESNSSGTKVSATLPLKTPPSTLKEHYAISGSIKT